MRIAINGLGRIGRPVLKLALEKGIKVVAVNDLAPINTLAYLLKYDSVYGPYSGKIKVKGDFLKINGKKIKVFSKSDPSLLPWKDLNIDYVVECTGVFKDKESASKHLKAGAKKVIISSPSKDADITIVLGVNNKSLKPEHKIISMASCTTNCLAPLAKVLNDKFGIKKGFMTTIHAYTNDQRTLDLDHKKLRRGRAAGINIIPTTSGATTATAQVIPSLKNKIDGLAFRVPVACGSIVDFVAELKKKPTQKQINNSLKKSAKKEMKGIIQYSEQELVSSDIIGNPYSCIIDSLSTQVIGNTVKILAWYDNEYGYSTRMIELLKKL